MTIHKPGARISAKEAEQGYMDRPMLPTCKDPTDPQSLYFRVMYRTFFYGPFPNLDAVIAAVKSLDKWDEYWDYDCFAVMYGADPLPDDYVGGFRHITHEERKFLESQRKLG